MPLKLKYLDEGRGAVAKASGRLTGAELIDIMTKVNAPGPAGKRIVYAFFDFNGVEGVDISTPQLRDAAAISVAVATDGSSGRVVAIHAKDDLPFALSRMWLVFIEQTGWEAMVFRERSKAVAWLRDRVAGRFGIKITLK